METVDSDKEQQPSQVDHVLNASHADACLTQKKREVLQLTEYSDLT